MKGRILYIEDDKDLAKVIAEDLLFEGFHIVWGEDIKTMYKLLEEDSWDVLLLDLELKQQNTLQEIPKIRKKYPFLKIVVASSNVLGTVIRQCDESGTDDYLKKPYDIEEALLSLEKVIPETIRIGNYLFLPQTQVLEYVEETKKLSPKESQLLRLLIDSKGESVSYAEIYQKIWRGMENEGSLNNIVSSLRNHLKKDENVQVITMRGIGLKLFVRMQEN